MDKDIGLRIRQKRQEMGLTMAALGELVGVQSSAVNKWEKGMVGTMKSQVIDALCEIFDVSPAWLLGISLEDMDMKQKADNVWETDDADAQALFSLIVQMSPEKKKQLLDFAIFLISKQQ